MRPRCFESAAPRKRTTRASVPAGRRGAVLVLLTLLMIPLMAMVAFSVDHGYLRKVECDLQRSADAAALAAVQDLVPATDGTQDLSKVRNAVRQYVALNLDSSFQVEDSDIQIGRYDPATIYSNVTLLNTGVFDTVRVTLRRDGTVNSRVPLFLAPLLGTQTGSVTATATAVLQRASLLPTGADVLPFAVPENVWDAQGMGEQWSIYGDGQIADDDGNHIPGNWGTVDVGSTDNSTSDQNAQILDGLRQSDLNALYDDGRIATNQYIDATQTVSMQSDTGLSTGLKNSVIPIEGQMRVIPIYDSSSGTPGNNLEINIVKWGVVRVISSTWNGSKNTHVVIEKVNGYQGLLRPQPSLSTTTGYVQGAFTAPVLVE